MKCLDPILCYTDSKSKRIFRHWSMASEIFRTQYRHQVFNCGKCLFCRKKKSIELASRCVLHASMYERNCFLTLTYDEENVMYHNNFEYSDIQKFKKRLRKAAEPEKIEIFNVHEYGKNGKKHWHLIVFNYDFKDKKLHTIKNGNNLYTSKKLSELWPHGFNTIGDVSEGSAMYQAQYTQKDFLNGNITNNKRSHSKHSGIGRPYFLKHYRQILSLGYIPMGNKKVPIPRYFEKLAHKHWCHFFDTSAFHDTVDRKALYRPFKLGHENREIAEYYKIYRDQKDNKILELAVEWEDIVDKYLDGKEKPDFIKSAENRMYDLKNKNQQSIF